MPRHAWLSSRAPAAQGSAGSWPPLPESQPLEHQCDDRGSVLDRVVRLEEVRAPDPFLGQVGPHRHLNRKIGLVLRYGPIQLDGMADRLAVKGEAQVEQEGRSGLLVQLPDDRVGLVFRGNPNGCLNGQVVEVRAPLSNDGCEGLSADQEAPFELGIVLWMRLGLQSEIGDPALCRLSVYPVFHCSLGHVGWWTVPQSLRSLEPTSAPRPSARLPRARWWPRSAGRRPRSR